MIKKSIGKVDYLERTDISEWKKHIWTRAKCGNIYYKMLRGKETTELEKEDSRIEKLYKNLVGPLECRWKMQ